MADDVAKSMGFISDDDWDDGAISLDEDDDACDVDENPLSSSSLPFLLECAQEAVTAQIFRLLFGAYRVGILDDNRRIMGPDLSKARIFLYAIDRPLSPLARHNLRL